MLLQPLTIAPCDEGDDACAQACRTGDEGCVCYANETCNRGLVCEASVCVAALTPEEDAGVDLDTEPDAEPDLTAQDMMEMDGALVTDEGVTEHDEGEACEGGMCEELVDMDVDMPPCVGLECPPGVEVVGVTTGTAHSCALLAGGSVRCWGLGIQGRLGHGLTSGGPSPVDVLELSDVVELSGYSRHTCARRRGGEVVCWGLNENGQLGNGTTTSSAVPVSVFGLTDAVHISAGVSHSCAVRGNGEVWCWGINTYGQLGDGSTTRRTVPILVTGIEDASEVHVGADHTCALHVDKTVSCWGRNIHGQLGQGNTSELQGPQRVPFAMPGDVEGLVVGDEHNCVWNSAGEALCWGRSERGQLGHGGTGTRSSPQPVVGLGVGMVKELWRGRRNTCAHRSTGRVMCWGDNTYGELGAEGVPLSSTALELSGLSGVSVRQISGGVSHMCAVLDDGDVRCWGNNEHGQLGPNHTSSAAEPVLVAAPLGLEPDGVWAGEGHVCARSASPQRVACWGSNTHGQLGTGSVMPALSPTQVMWPEMWQISMMALANGYTCLHAQERTGMTPTVRCWGDNRRGQLGVASTTQLIASSSSAAQPAVEGVSQVSAGGGHVCARTEGDEAWCWGGNSDGQLGDGTAASRHTPAMVEGLAGVKQVAAGSSFSCALLEDGTVSCWGLNASGQLGTGDRTSQRTPVAVAGLSDVVEVVAGQQHACARQSSGPISCWGRNESNQTGYSSTTDRLTAGSPSGLMSLAPAQLAAGASHTCARTQSGEVWCWGSGVLGQLGNGAYAVSALPSRALVPGAVEEISAQGNITCALTTHAQQREVWCWGANDQGQLGQGTVSRTTTPTRVFLQTP